MDQNIILPLHLLVLAFAVWNIVQADHMGFMWLKGKIRMLDEANVKKYHRNVWIGLCGMIATGFLMFWPMREYLMDRPQFWAKMFWVGALIANGFIIGRLQRVALHKPFAELTTKEKLPLLMSGTVSGLGWVGAATLAFFIVEEF